MRLTSIPLLHRHCVRAFSTGPFTALPPEVRSGAERVSSALSSEQLPHAICGAVACNAYGHRRATQDVNLLVNMEELHAACKILQGDGWKPRYQAARRSWVDTVNKVKVDLLVSGEFPGDGLSKPVSFPHLTNEAGFNWIEVGGVRVLGLVELISIKLASSATAPHRRKDAADVSALIEAQHLPREFVLELHVSVRPLFVQLWDEVQQKRASGLH